MTSSSLCFLAQFIFFFGSIYLFFKSPFENQCQFILLSPLFQLPVQDQQNGKHCHLMAQSFRITIKDTSSICINPTGLSSLHDFKFSHERVYPNMIVKNIQIHVENGFACQNIKIRHFNCPQEKLSPQSLSSSPRQRKITHLL